MVGAVVGEERRDDRCGLWSLAVAVRSVCSLLHINLQNAYPPNLCPCLADLHAGLVLILSSVSGLSHHFLNVEGRMSAELTHTRQ
eukprot:COSAG05_NODE_160_length_15590_cov_14.460848_8_plen_85_part_00